MNITEMELEKAVKMAISERWENGLPTVRARLRLAVNSLHQQSRGNFPRDGKSLYFLIRKKSNGGIREILKRDDVSVEAFAFAIRDALS